MTLIEFAALSPEERRSWIASDEHRFNCAAHSEGQECCLEKLDSTQVEQSAQTDNDKET